MTSTDFGTIDLTAPKADVKQDPTRTLPAAEASDPLDAIFEALDESIPVPSILVAVEHRPGWAVRYRVDVAWSEIQDWRKKARSGKRIDAAFLSRLILANTCLGFVHDGKDQLDGNGNPVTFGTIAGRRNLTVADAVKAWLVTDGAVSGTSDLVYQRSGYDMPEAIDEDDEDPTQA